MNHEPECPYVQPSIRGEIVDATTCGWCDIIRVAYQRGREDAAQAVEAILADVPPTPWIEVVVNTITYAEAAARGDGEQA